MLSTYRIAVLLSLIAVAHAAPVQGGPIYSVQTQIFGRTSSALVPFGGIFIPEHTFSENDVASGETGARSSHSQTLGLGFSHGLPFAGASAAAEAGSGSLSAVARSTAAGGSLAISSIGADGFPVSSTVSLSGASSAFAAARFTLDDLVFSGPSDSVLVDRTFLEISGDLTATAHLDALNAFGLSSISVQGSIRSGSEVLTEFEGHASRRDETDNVQAVENTITVILGSGEPSFDHDIFFSNGSFVAPTGVPLIYELELQAVGNAFAFGRRQDVTSIGPISQGIGDFDSTLTFPTTGPVFDLPDGYTVNSVQGQIVDNRWVGAAASAVPEPSSLLLLAIGGFGIAGCYLRGRKLAARAA